MKKSTFSLFVLMCTVLAAARFCQAQYQIEDLGSPVRLPAPIEFSTTSGGHTLVWVNVNSVAWDQGKHAYAEVVGIDAHSGKIYKTINLQPYGRGAKARVIKTNEDTLYIFTGKPARFLKYQITENVLTPVGMPSTAEYWMDDAVAADGKIYFGTYPNAAVTVLDPQTDRVEHWKKLSPDPRQKYVTIPIIGDDGTIYFPVGQHHAELYAYNPQTQAKRQILPENPTKAAGAPLVWRGQDGHIYGKAGEQEFRCYPDHVEITKASPRIPPTPQAKVDGKIAVCVDAQNNLELRDPASKQTSLIPTQFAVPGTTVFSIGDVVDGKLYGGTAFPANTFSYDLSSGALADLGRISWARIQVYDTLGYKHGFFLSSYVAACIDYYNLQTKKRRHIAQLSKEYGQERVYQMEVGPDGMIYAGTVPTKGRLGGALVRINPQNYQFKVWPDIIHNQSLTSVVSVPATGEVFVTSSTAGGTSAIPTEKEAVVFLWNAAQEKIDFRARPLPGSSSYGKAVRAANGIIYGFGGGVDYYAFDPVKRQTIFTGKIPQSPGSATKRPPLLCDSPGPHGCIYAVDRDAGNLIAIDPASHKARIVFSDPSLRGIIAVNTASDGNIYYGSGGHLMRIKMGA